MIAQERQRERRRRLILQSCLISCIRVPISVAAQDSISQDSFFYLSKLAPKISSQRENYSTEEKKIKQKIKP